MAQNARVLSPGSSEDIHRCFMASISFLPDSKSYLLRPWRNGLDDSRADMWSRYTGEVDGFISGSEKMASNKVKMLHVLTPANIDIRENFALAESVGQITCRFDHQSHEYDVTSWFRSISRMEKAHGSWKMLSFQPIYIRDDIKPVGSAPQLDFEQVKEWPRKSYRYIAWHIMQSGGQPRQDLYGEDDEKSVETVRSQSQQWLDSIGNNASRGDVDTSRD